MINDFVNLYFEFGSIDNALIELRKIVPSNEYERFLAGLNRFRKGKLLRMS
jgi:hypothetical protein